MQQHAQFLSADRPAAFGLVHHEQHAVLGVLVKGAVTDEVEDVILTPPQAALQRRQRRLSEPFNGHQALRAKIGHRLLQLGPLPVCVQRWIAAGRRDHRQDPDGRLHGQRTDALGEVEIANEWRLARENEEAVEGRIVEELPGQIGQLRRGSQVQAQPQSCAPLSRNIQTPAQTAPHLVAEGGLEQPPAEILGQLYISVFEPAHVAPRVADPQEKVFDFEIGEGQGEVTGCWDSRTAQNVCPVARLRALKE